MQPAKAVSRIDAIASRRVRLSMLLVLALIAVVVVVQAWQAGKAEASRSTDAEIITLAGAQRVHSQRIARLALQSANDTAQIELDMVLLNSEAQAQLLERLLADQGMMTPDPVVASDKDAAFREAINTWQASRVQFVASVNRFIQARETYEFAELPLVSRAIQKQADVFFLNSQRLVEQAQIFAQSHGETATRSSLNWTALIMALLGLLAVGVVEPTARFVRRQYELLKAQTDEMQRLALVAATTSNWVIVASTRRKVTWANRAFLTGVGLTSEQVFGKDFLSFVSPKGNDLEELGRAGEELKQGLGVRVEVLALARDGQGVWLDVDCQPLFDDQGGVTGFLAVGNDVTEQVNQRRKLRALFDALPVGVILYTKTGSVADCNTTALKMTQLQVHEFANYETMTMTESRMHPGVRTVRDDLSDYPLAEQPVVRTLQTRRGLRRESVGYLRADGKVFWTLVSTEPLIDAQGQVSGVVECFLDVSRQKRLEQQLRDISRTDNLTQLPNRVVVTDQIRAALMRRHAQPGYHFAVLFMDFDRFKQVNDTLGHGVGDELLRQIAQRLQVSLRPGDSFVRTSDFGQMAARIGGDEFVVVLDDIRGDLDAEVVAGRLLDVLAIPYVIGEHTVNSSVSIGIVTATHATDEVESVLRDADIAMYEAKRTGRGRYVMFDPAMHRRVRDDVSLENDLRQALGQGELFVVYQPLIDLNSGALAGMEALVRWKHPQRGMVSPVEFIPVAEAGGLIVKLGAFVLQTACAEFAAMRVTLGADAPGSVSVNLSRAQLREPDLVANIQDVLRSNGLEAGQLQLEITESLAAQDHAVQAKLREIKALGVTLALDDFGTGYSSLSCLHELPIDTVKIDRAFVSVAQGSDYHRVLIEATILVAETLGMSTVAEGIETADQADMMRALRCSKGQGYLYSKPLQRDELVQWIEASRALA